MTPNGLFPKVLVVDDGTRVTIVNRDPDQTDTIDCVPGGHDISDDPHPTHGDSPEFGSGRLTLNQSRVTQNLVTPGAFGVHDHCHGSGRPLQGPRHRPLHAVGGRVSDSARLVNAVVTRSR